MHNYMLDDETADPKDDGRTTSTTTSDTHTQQLTRQAHRMTTTTKPDAMNTIYGCKRLLTKTCGNHWKTAMRRETPEALGIMQKEF